MKNNFNLLKILVCVYIYIYMNNLFFLWARITIIILGVNFIKFECLYLFKIDMFSSFKNIIKLKYIDEGLR